MRIIKESRVKQFMEEHPLARPSLERWVRLTRNALWRNFTDVRCTFPHADAVTVGSGKKAMVFDIHGNEFRLITAVHYAVEAAGNGARLHPSVGGRVYVFHCLTHAEYDRNQWKETL